MAMNAVDAQRLEFATRLAIICALTTLITEIYQTPEPALTAYVVFFLNRPERTISLIMCLALTLVVSLLIGFVFIVANVVIDEPMWRVISIAVISFGLLFLTSASKLRPVAGTFALIIGYALDMLGGIQAGELATRGLLYAWLFVGIPAAVSFLINLLLAPAPRRAAEQAIARKLLVATAVLRRPGSAERARLAQVVHEGIEPVLKLLKLAGMEKTAPAQDLIALRQATLSSWALISAVHTSLTQPGARLPPAACERLADVLEQMARILEQGGYPVEVSSELPADGELTPLAAQLLAEIQDALRQFADAVPAPALPVEKKPGGFLVTDAFTSPVHVQYALKTTAAALFCYVLYSLLDWPGIHTCFLTCYIVAQTTTAESVEKLTLRIVGCLIGASMGIAAIVFLVPALTSVGALLLTVFAGAWLAAYVAGGSARISYAGFQIAFAFFLCVIQGAGPAFDMVVARDRIIGIVIGNLVAWFVMVHVWPSPVSNRVDLSLAVALKRMAAILTAKSPPERRLLASEAHEALSCATADLDLAGYEPAPVRAPEEWRSGRRRTIGECRSLIGLLALSAQPGTPVPASAELQRLQRLVTPDETQDGAAHHARS